MTAIKYIRRMALLASFAGQQLASKRGEACVIGGQAVMEGVMMRNGEHYALALRRADGTIVAERFPWFSLTRGWLKMPLLRGFPTLIETLVNGIRALNRSAIESAEGEGQDLQGWHLVLTMLVAIGMAVILFVVLPHVFSLVMAWLGLGGDVDGLSFHLWDGLFKFLIFIGYILAISLVPDIRRVFQYHGAEHKVIRAFESGDVVSVSAARRLSRLHPRCGTTFLLFVLTLAIVLHTVFVPLFSGIWSSEHAVLRHIGILVFKLALMLPISAVAYELIRYAGAAGDGLIGRMLRAPGMLLQMLTTWEPDNAQIEVAIVSLAVALGPDVPPSMNVPDYSQAE